MKAVILAAGEGRRMRPLTEDTPKPLLPVAGKPIIQHTIEQLEEAVEKIIVVAGYRKEDIEEYFSGSDLVRVVEQDEPRGTAHAALQARDYIDGKTVILNGDDIYGIEWEKLEGVERGIAVAEVGDPENYGVVRASGGKLDRIVEKPWEPDSSLVNTGFYIVEEDFFPILEKVEESERGEYEITEAVEKYREENELEVVELETWIPCSYPWQLLEANSELMEDIEGNIEGKVSDSAVLKGKVVVEEAAEIRENTVVEGPAVIKSGAKVGPGAYIREGTVLHENVHVGKCEVKNSIIREDSNAPHFNYVGDSYLGRQVNLGAGTKTANLRNDGKTVAVKTGGEYIDTGVEKVGAFIASQAKIGLNCSINPGTKIGAKVKTDSGEKLRGTIPSGATVKDGAIDEDRN